MFLFVAFLIYSLNLPPARPSRLQTIESVVGVSEVKKLKTQIHELERLLGRKTLENKILKDAVEIARKKSDSCAHRCFPRTIPSEAHKRDLRITIEMHPHKALKMASPREFIRKLSTNCVY